jgi:hypothetical protein
MKPHAIRHAFYRLLDAFSASRGIEARAHARLLVAMMGEFPWLNKQISSDALARVFRHSGYLRAEERRAA